MIAVGEAVLSFPDYVLKPVRKELLERGVNVVVPRSMEADTAG